MRQNCLHCGTRVERGLDAAVVIRQLHGHTYKVIGGGSISVATDEGEDLLYTLRAYICPVCAKTSVDAVKLEATGGPGIGDPSTEDVDVIPLVPFCGERFVASEVPEDIAADFKEASRIAGLSLKGASTLARRCLQKVLRAHFKDMPNKDLFDEIKWVEENGLLDAEITKTLHALRKAGNFGAHPEKSGMTLIYELTPEDLDGCFVLLELLFEQFYVIPSRRNAKLGALKERMFPETKKL